MVSKIAENIEKESDFLKSNFQDVISESANNGKLKPIEPEENSEFYNSKDRYDMLTFLENPFKVEGTDGFFTLEEDGPAEWVEEFDKKVSEDWTGFFVKNGTDGANNYADFMSYGEDALKIATDYTKKALEWANSFGLDNESTKNTISLFENPLTNLLSSWMTSWMGGNTTTSGSDNYSSGSSQENNKETEREKEVSNLNFTEENPFENPVNLIFNKNIQKMIDAGPDLFSNSFDTFLLVENKKDNSFFPLKKEHLKFQPVPMESFLDNFNEISIRNSKISIPQRLNATYDQKFLNQSITKVSHSVEFENKAELSLDLDNNLLIIDLMNNLINLPNWICEVEDLDGELSFTNKQEFEADDYSKFFATSYNRGNGNLQLDVVVNSRSFKPLHHAFYNPNYETDVNNILYIFQNVRFLGTDSISFDRTSWNLQNKSFPFVFSNLFEVYKVTSDLATNDSNRNGIIIHPLFMDNDSLSVREI